MHFTYFSTPTSAAHIVGQIAVAVVVAPLVVVAASTVTLLYATMGARIRIRR